MNEPIYLDNNSTTRIDPRVLDEMMPFLKEDYGNPSSSHILGRKAKVYTEQARTKVAKLVDCDPKDLIFTSGATEALNLALAGIVSKSATVKRHIVTVNTEHKAVLETCRSLENLGYVVTYLPVGKDGHIILNQLYENLRPDTLAVCVMIANNETGVLHPIAEIAAIAHQNGSLCITDGTQAVGKIPVSMTKMGVDILAFSSHKIYGPKGIGALCISKECLKNAKIRPIIHGGGQERELRSGTLNVAAIVGFGAAAHLTEINLTTDRKRIEPLRDCLEKELLKFERSYVNGDQVSRLFNTTSICFPGIDAESVISDLKSICVSNGSACTSAVVEPSHVLRAMAITDDDAFGSIRFSLGRFNTAKEIDLAILEIKDVLSRARLAIDAGH